MAGTTSPEAVVKAAPGGVDGDLDRNRGGSRGTEGGGAVGPGSAVHAVPVLAVPGTANRDRLGVPLVLPESRLACAVATVGDRGRVVAVGVEADPEVAVTQSVVAAAAANTRAVPEAASGVPDLRRRLWICRGGDGERERDAVGSVSAELVRVELNVEALCGRKARSGEHAAFF